jgi:hypothetical protein
MMSMLTSWCYKQVAILVLKLLVSVVVFAFKEIHFLVLSSYISNVFLGVCREAALSAMRENIDAQQISTSNFTQALRSIPAHTNAKLLRTYEEFSVGRLGSGNDK